MPRPLFHFWIRLRFTRTTVGQPRLLRESESYPEMEWGSWHSVKSDPGKARVVPSRRESAPESPRALSIDPRWPAIVPAFQAEKCPSPIHSCTCHEYRLARLVRGWPA